MPRVTHVALAAVVALIASTAAGAVGPRVFHGQGITIRTPSGWYVGNKPLNGINNPVQRFVLSSYQVPPGADAGGSYVPSSHGVIAQLVEDVPASGKAGAWPPRPGRFTLPKLGRMETLDGNRWGEVIFREHGRDFYIFIWVGRLASSTQTGLLLRALDAMTVTAG